MPNASIFYELSRLDEGLVVGIFAAIAMVALLITVIVSVIAVQWRKLRQAELELSFKHEMLERGLTVSQIERLLDAGRRTEPSAEATSASPEAPSASAPRLLRSSRNRVFAGVCGGFGEYLGIDATLLRFFYVVVLIFTGFVPALLVYAVAACIMPLDRLNG